MNAQFLFPLIALLLLAETIVHPSYAQTITSSAPEHIAVTARPSQDSISLRWAPLAFDVWQRANEYGYRIERYTIVRNEAVLPVPERTLLASILKPMPEESWEQLVRGNAYAAIAAQALFGDRFEIDLRQSDVFTIVNKVEENQQRFAIALFSADMSGPVAHASGLRFTDTHVLKGDRYLYRVTVNGADSLRGSVYISPDDTYHLSQPMNLKAEFKGRFVSLRWDHSKSTPYTAYKVERSRDGLSYTEISATPLVTISPAYDGSTRYEYATDSLPDAPGKYYYRVTGITPFGEKGPPSESVNGSADPVVESLPFIRSAENRGNNSIVLEWEFRKENNHAIEGFAVERASGPKGIFLPLNSQLLTPETRSFEDIAPEQTNYYRVRARGLDQEWYPSHVYLAQLVDSIPPARPSNLTATVEQNGKVLLSWAPTGDRDLYGYRIYRANNIDEEPAQITTGPVSTTTFNDSVNLLTLNENIYYRVMAIDVNQNHSALSEQLTVSLPDVVRPQSPVFLPVVCTPHAVKLSWLEGGSTDIVSYRIYRKYSKNNSWQLLKNYDVTGDTVYTYTDQTLMPGETAYYTALSVDDAGLESHPAPPVSGLITRRLFQDAVTWKKPAMDREENRLTISWKYETSGVESFKIFRSANSELPIHYKTVTGDHTKYTDQLIPGKSYRYRIMAVFKDGRTSLLSEELEFEY